MGFGLTQSQKLKLQNEGGLRSYQVYNGTNRIKVLNLLEDTEISGIPCKAGYPIYFDFNQNFREGNFVLLAENCVLYGVPFAKNTPLTFGSKGRISSGVLAEDFQLDPEILLKERTKIYFKDWNTSDLFWRGTIKHSSIIQGYPCKGGTEITMENGRLQCFVPSVEGYMDFEGHNIPVGSPCEIFRY